jgi:ketosteroid isomerase-like protein
MEVRLGETMTTRADIESAVRSLYAARVKGDLEKVLAGFADDAVFGLNGRGTQVAALATPSKGKAALRPLMKDLIDTWRFDDWKELALLVDGERALLHWTARVTCLPTNKTEQFEVFDLITFRDGKVVDHRQSTDTALMKALAS